MFPHTCAHAHTVPHIHASIEKEREQLWWGTPIVSALGRCRQEDQQFGASLDYMRLYLKPHINATEVPQAQREGEVVM